jgi:outer membrane protein assembly factor BamA
MHKINGIWAVCCAVVMVACSETKFVPDGQYLLDKVVVTTDGKYPDVNISNMKNYVRQKGNSRWFSAVKIPLTTYSLAGRDTSKWINRTLQQFGEPPVIFDTLKAQLSCNELQQALVNQGYLRASVNMNTTTNGKKLKAHYILHPGEVYRIGNMRYVIKDENIAELLCMNDTAQWGLHIGDKFNTDNLNQERTRISNLLTDNGYFLFNKEFISYTADTIANSKEISLTFILEKYSNRSVQNTLHQRYHIRQVNYESGDPEDSIIHLRKKVIYNNTFMRPFSYYSNKDLQNTYNHFGRLQAVKYTNISFTPVADTTLLDCNIQLSTNKPSTISFEPEGTNTAGDLGAAASLTYQNRNIFHGSEIFSVQLRGAYEAIKGLEGYSNENFLEYSAETGLSFPQLVAPFLSRNFRRRIIATSQLSLMYDLQNRPEYHRRVLSAAWKYKWHDSNHHDQYVFDLLDLNYVFMPWISDTFRKDYLDDTSNSNAILRYNYEDLFIMKMGFGYTYNNGKIAIKTNVETAGNLLSLGSKIFTWPTNDLGQSKFINIAFAQYVKGDVDFTRNYQFDYNNALVFHVGFGIAYPYGNSSMLPFEKRYFSGGANSVRGWSVRELGPGKYCGQDGRIDFLNQTGDMKLDLNLEYRAHLFWKLNGAIFVDAGNIWTLRNYADQPGGQFKFGTFYQQLAASYGAGFRFNFDYFIVRFDLGMKAVNPAEGEEHYPIIKPRLSRDFTFHFAVGLPF